MLVQKTSDIAAKQKSDCILDARVGYHKGNTPQQINGPYLKASLPHQDRHYPDCQERDVGSRGPRDRLTKLERVNSAQGGLAKRVNSRFGRETDLQMLKCSSV